MKKTIMLVAAGLIGLALAVSMNRDDTAKVAKWNAGVAIKNAGFTDVDIVALDFQDCDKSMPECKPGDAFIGHFETSVSGTRLNGYVLVRTGTLAASTPVLLPVPAAETSPKPSPKPGRPASLDTTY